MESKSIEAQKVGDQGTAALSNSGAHPGKVQPAPDETTPRYQVILRHLAKFRDHARALLDIFGEPAPAPLAGQLCQPPRHRQALKKPSGPCRNPGVRC